MQFIRICPPPLIKTEVQIDQILSAENLMLHEIFKAIAKMDLDHVLSDTMRASLSPIATDLETYGERKK